jgi:polygalacturonase
MFLRRTGYFFAPLLLPASSWGAEEAAEEPSFEFAQFNVRTYGAKGDGQSKDTRPIQAAINAAGRTGGMIHFPAGNYLCGTLRLKSHTVVHLEAGARLIASPDDADFDHYERLDYNSFSDQETTDFNFALLQGRDLDQISIVGPGQIDGNRAKRGGPKPIALKRCGRVLIRDLTISNAPNYNISLL